MKKVLVGLSLLISSVSVASTIREYKAYNVIAPDAEAGYSYQLNKSGACELIKRKKYSEYKISKITSRKEVDLKNCKAELISKKIRSTLKNSCMESSKTIDAKGSSERGFFKRGEESSEYNRLSFSCMCEKVTMKRTWLSNSENIFLNPLNTFFNGPTTKSKTKHELLSVDDCSALTKNPSEFDAIIDAYRSVEELLER